MKDEKWDAHMADLLEKMKAVQKAGKWASRKAVQRAVKTVV
jgi:hypothetical protein